MKRLFFISTIVIFLSIMSGCNAKPKIDIAEVSMKTEKIFRELDNIGTTASAFDGKKDVKVRLMVEEYLTEEEATLLFNKIFDSFKKYSNYQDIWEYYNGYFDIKSYENGAIIFQANEIIGQDLKVEETFIVE